MNRRKDKLNVTRRNALLDICTVAGAVFLDGCAVNPVTGRREFMLMSEQQEIALGKQSHPEITASYGVYSDRSLQEWFTKKGVEMTRITPRKNLPYTFSVLDSPVVNAFAVPGGYVYVTRGILGYFNDEAQFAGVLGHELGHIEARHSARQYSKIQLANLAIGVGSVLSEEFNRYSFLVSMGTTLMFLKFSREDERQADRLGVEYSSRCGYDATRISEFFITLERMQPSGGSLPEWASTHPNPGDRVAATRRMALEYQKANPNTRYVVRSDEYLELVNGLTFGDDPRQGYVKNGFFYQPDLKFMFPVPSGWSLTNQPNEVRMSPKKQDQAALVLRLAQGANLLDTSVKFASANNITITDSKQITANDLKGLATLGRITSQNQDLSIASYFFQMDGRIIAFHGLAPTSSFGAIEPEFAGSAMGIRRLTDKSLIDVSPDRINVRGIQRAGTLKTALQAFGVPAGKLNDLAILNGMNLEDSLKPGTKIKVVG